MEWCARWRRPRLRCRALVLGGILLAAAAAAAVAARANASASRVAAPPPAFVVAAARREAAGLGDPAPSAAQYVLTRHEAAVHASSGATGVTNQPVYLVLLTGRFETGPVGPAPGRVVTGTFASMVLDARTGRDTDFAIGSQRVPIGSLGPVGNLLPYMRGTAVPACSAPDLRATASFQGATGSQLGGVGISNRGSLPCALPPAAKVSLAWRGHPLSVRTTSFPSGWLGRMNPRWARPVAVLAPRARAQVVLQWLNWCGPAPWGRNRGFHLTVALRVPHQPAAILAATADLVAAPYCNQKAAGGTGSTLRVGPFVSPS